MEKLNIAEILKDCPKGMELYSPLCGKCVFDRISYGTIVCIKQNKENITFTSKGYYMLPVSDDCECMIFPSKENRDWSTFQRPFKDGDVVYIQSVFEYIAIYKKTNCKNLYKHAAICITFNNRFLQDNTILCYEGDVRKIRLATEEEKQKLFDAIKADGYKWNTETKTLEKLEVNKFDISTLKPFESRVLVRSSYGDIWRPAIYGVIDSKKHYHYVVGGNYWTQCIPFEPNKELLGTTDDCDDFYKTWE